MFHKLRLKLTFINSVIIALLFLILTTGTYLFAEKQMKHRAFSMGRDLITDIQAGLIEDIPDHEFRPQDKRPPHDEHQPPVRPLIFFAKTGSDNRIFFASSAQPLEASSLAALVLESLEAEETTGIIHFEKSYYYYIKAPLQEQSGMIVLFQDFEPETNLLHSLITALAIIGVICLLLSLIASFYMANRAMIPIESAWEQQKAFLADVSHELRTPLTIMQTNLGIVLDTPEGTIASQKKWLHNIKEEADAMTKLVHSLLFLARADSNQPLLDKKIFSLTRTLTRSMEVLTPLATAKGITLRLFLPSNITLYGDEGSFRQLISILFDNALRHTPAGGNIIVSLSQEKKEITLIFSDTGEGIEKKHLEKIYDRFYQVDNSRAKGGAGLGLSIAKLIIAAHGGSIKVFSQPALGTEFHIKLPVS